MKYLPGILACLLLIGLSLSFAGGDKIKVTVQDCYKATTNTVTVRNLSGYVEKIKIDSVAAKTNKVLISNADNTILTIAAATDGIYRPVESVHTSAGTVTNANAGARYYLYSDTVTVAVAAIETLLTTNDVIVTIWMSDN